MTETTDRQHEARPSKVWWKEWLKSLLIAVGIALLIRWPIAEPFRIPSGSMEPTFYNGDRIFVNKHTYGVRWPFNGFTIPFTPTTIWYTDSRMLPGRAPERWDIVVFKSVEGRVDKHTLVKRIVGLPGERVHIADGRLYINSEPIPIPDHMPEDLYYTRPVQSNGYGIFTDDEHALVPEDHYFLLGDNSDHSRDGRWFGFVPNHHLLGPVSSIWWPIGRWHDFTGFSDTWWWNGSLALLVLYTVVRLFVGRSWKVKEGIAEMLRPGDHVFVRFSLGIPVPFTGLRFGRGRPLNRGDLVLYRSPRKRGGDPEHLLGVIGGLPGERVQIRNDVLLVNGKPADDFPDSLDLGSGTGRYGIESGKENTRVPPGRYYLLSDAGGGAEDSRTLGWIPASAIVGHVSRVWFPPSSGRRISTA